MDRLEKALEKARQQRKRAGAPLVVMPRACPALPGFSPDYDFTPPESASIDDTRLERYRIVAHQPRRQEADAYRQLRTKILHIMRQAGLKTLAITSPRPGDGKTTTAINLGVSIALDLKQTVLMVDLDLRKPCLHEFFGVKAQPGLTGHLLHDIPIHDCLARPAFARLNTLPAGAARDHSSELLGSPKMAALARELKTRYPDRLIIYDMPPVLAQDDPIAFLPHIDAVLVVVRDGVTRADDLRRCLQSLAGANVIGTVLNKCW